MSLRRRLLVLLVLSFAVHVAALVLLPDDGQWVESVYARGIYPVIGPAVAFLPSLSSFSVAATGILALIAGGSVYMIVNLVRWRRRRLSLTGAVGRVLLAGTVVGICLFHGFYLFWGYNYLRPPLEQRLGIAEADESEAARIATARLMVQQAVDAIVPTDFRDKAELNRLIDEAMDRALRELEGRAVPVVSPLKSDLGTGYLARAGNGGVINPLTLEAHVDFGLPSFELAFVAAHEKAHLAGFARERDANFVAWYALTGSEDPRLRFAGHFGVVRNFLNAKTQDLSEPLLPYLRAAAAYQRDKVVPIVRNAGRRVYSVYMKANRMESGLADYGEVASLIHAWLQRDD